jgi:hypothetical protein
VGGGVVRHEVLSLGGSRGVEERVDVRGSAAVRSELRLGCVGAGAGRRRDIRRNFGGEHGSRGR